MKKLFKALAVLAAALALGFGFTSCSNGDDDDNSGGSSSSSTGNAIFQSSKFYYGTIQIEYKTDGTYLMTWSLGDYDSSRATNKGKGTYTLDGTFENGTIHQHQTHTSDTLSSEWEEEIEDTDLTVTDGKFTVDLGTTVTFTLVS
mgnify:CR=1 FL=1